MSQSSIDTIRHCLLETMAVKFAYLFGSQARQNTGPLSDVDIAVYIDKRHSPFSFRLLFQEKIDRLLKGKQSCDLVILNNAALTLQYEIIKDGKILKENKPKRIQFETDVLRKYLDMDQMRSVYMSALKRSFLKEPERG